MYDPLIQIRHKDGSETFIRASDIQVLKNWTNEKGIISTKINLVNVTNLKEILERVNEIEDRNELSNLMK